MRVEPRERVRVAEEEIFVVVSVSFGTNHLSNFEITPAQQQILNTGTNRFAAIAVEPLQLGTNQVIGWRVNDDPAAIADIERADIVCNMMLFTEEQAAAVLPSAATLDKILRYESALERQIYRAIHELERAQRRRLGEVVPAPLAVEVSAKG